MSDSTLSKQAETASGYGYFRARMRHYAKPFRQASRTSRWLVFAGLGILIFFTLVAAVGPELYGFGATQYRVETAPGQFQQIPQLAPPSATHPMGTTRDGFDVMARVIGGAKLALIVMGLAVSVAMLIGVSLGLASGYRGGPIDRILVTVMDSVYAFPPLVLAIIISFILGAFISPGVFSAAFAVGVVYIPQYFRVVRNQTLAVKQETFVEAAQSLGAKSRSILTRYVFFNVVHTVPVLLTLNAADAILTLAALGFLGYGVQPPTPEWGYDISQAITDVSSGIWWTAFWPGVAIVTLVTGITLVGEGVNDVVNPLLRARGASGPRLPRRQKKPRKGADVEDDSYAVSVRDLRVGYRTPKRPLWAVDGVDFDIRYGESLGLVGESGCGKSTLGRALMQLLAPGCRAYGSVRLGGEELIGQSERRLRQKRGDDVAMIFQEPMTRLNPLMRIGDHFVEMIRTHRSKISRKQARAMARDVLSQMGVPPSRIDNYAHELSGGMRQRVMIALGIVLNPKLLIADEPTTSLDVIVESQILDTIAALLGNKSAGLLMITHNLGIVAETCDRVAVMYAGRIVESGPVDAIFNDPKHPYTRGLLASTVSLETTTLHSIPGYPPDLLDPPSGCRFAERCPYAMAHCTEADPALTDVGPSQSAACFLYPGAGQDVPAGLTPPSGNPQVVGI
ncbi:MAG: dipeptide/oligopeptide/nickel ABC transporter permease/ATP-binding protein [Salinisphaera sp.]|jgi:oligopeptide/dipeptide ABC transporter ATP-binding protein|nr:dipeptide/oligopeptide/nickel ABC transporter permease/ATP-binding protein [Salinisphaera sp.]